METLNALCQILNLASQIKTSGQDTLVMREVLVGLRGVIGEMQKEKESAGGDNHEQ